MTTENTNAHLVHSIAQAERARVLELLRLASKTNLPPGDLYRSVGDGSTAAEVEAEQADFKTWPSPTTPPGKRTDQRHIAGLVRVSVRLRDALNVLGTDDIWLSEWDGLAGEIHLHKVANDLTPAELSVLSKWGKLKNIAFVNDDPTPTLAVKLIPQASRVTDLSESAEETEPAQPADDHLMWRVAERIQQQAEVSGGEDSWRAWWSKSAGQIKLERVPGHISAEEMRTFNHFGTITAITPGDDGRGSNFITLAWLPNAMAIGLVARSAER